MYAHLDTHLSLICRAPSAHAAMAESNYTRVQERDEMLELNDRLETYGACGGRRAGAD